MVPIEFDDQQVLMALQRLHGLTGNARPALVVIGEAWLESTKQRFVSSTAPDGSPWLLNTLATLEHKEGDKPLVDHLDLSKYIFYDASDTTLDIYSELDYAAMMQFGGTKEEFPHLWGDIPGREFIGASQDDIDEALAITEMFISRAIGT